jgi:prohibitin 2
MAKDDWMEERRREREEQDRVKAQLNQMMRRFVVGCSMVLLALTGFVTSCTVIGDGEVGVVRHMGAIQPHVLRGGLHFIRPFWFATVEDVDVKVQNAVVNASASSKDLQRAETRVEVQYAVVDSSAPCLVKWFGSEALEAHVFSPGSQESVKSNTAKYTAEQLVTRRAEVKQGIDETLRGYVAHTLKSKGCQGGVTIANVAITDFGFSKEFDAAIESKVKAEQEALRAVNEKTRRITNAEADAQERKLAAESIAYKTEVESKARAEAIERESKALASNPALVQLRIAEKWNGALPHMTGGVVPMLNLKGD